MRVVMLALAVVLAHSITAGAQTPATPPRDARQPATGTAGIQGRVTDANTGAPVRRAQVRVFRAAAGAPQNRSTRTDDDGRYALTDLAAGTYQVSVAANGYPNWAYGQTRPYEPGKPVSVRDRETAENIDMRVPRAAVLAGRILDEFGEPAADIQVIPLRYQFQPGAGRQALPAGRVSTTNDIGEFRIFGLLPGDYMLSASPANFAAGQFTDDRSGYAPTYYPQAVDIAQAQTLHIEAGQMLDGLTIMLIPARTATVTGIVVDSRGLPRKDGGITATPKDRSRGFFGANGPIRQDGSFSLSGLAPGTYLLRAMPSGQPGPTAESPAFVEVTVNGSDISGLRVAPVVPVSLRGRLVIDTGSPGTVSVGSLRVITQPSNPLENFGMGAVQQAPINPDLTFEVKAIPGRTMMTLTGMAPGWMVHHVRVNGEDAVNGIDVGERGVDDIEVMLTARVASVSGTVTDDRAEVVRAYTAIVFPADRNAWSTRTGGPMIGRPDNEGKYMVRPLRGGDYFVIAVDHVENGQWYDPEFLERVQAHATRLTIADGEARNVDLRIVEGR